MQNLQRENNCLRLYLIFIVGKLLDVITAFEDWLSGLTFILNIIYI